MSAPARKKQVHAPVKMEWKSLPVDIPSDFLAPLPNPSEIEVNVIDFAKTVIPEFDGLYAVILDGVLSPEECAQLIHYAEVSSGAHGPPGAKVVENNGWKEAMVNVGGGYEVIVPDYRCSDRIIWDHPDVMNRLWKRILQADEVREYLSVLHGEKYQTVLGGYDEEKWVPTKQGINERMRFLKYGAGQFFRRHCDGSYVTPDGKQESFFTMHLYLNDSAQALGIPEPTANSTDPQVVDTVDRPAELLRGGATTFHSRRSEDRRIDVDPKAGRVLIFQHRKLLHSGDDVKAGIKFTVRSDIMYERVE